MCLQRSCFRYIYIYIYTIPIQVFQAARCEPFAYTSVHARVLQALASAIRSDEPALLVGDTGTGKTSVVQHVGRLLGREVLVYNFNEQSESTELVGGFRPVDNVMQLMSELVESFCLTFEKSFSRRKNAKLLEKLRSDFLDRRWVRGPQAEAEIRGRRPCRPSQDWSFRDLTQAAVLNDVGSIVSKAHPGKWQHC
ncbi:Midasin (Dynein-related AAA-ATPase mdn1) (MIDAS-containing protein) [Durusdinium trenchii]|uniref:Midasin (Dynein-related AAA-ATPase mdn1) (MIDAS-containing protein) n=1 Tax=Durusdinium trenchii TaxID=1381693 RepID=A0ABP0QYJ6_9DINO